MKKIFLAIVVALFSLNAMAQHEIGGIVGGMMGASYKYWFNGAMAIQADLAVGLTQAAYKNISVGQYDFTINPNFEYHWALPVQNLKIFAGGGINFGLCNSFANSGNAAAAAAAAALWNSGASVGQETWAELEGGGGSSSSVMGKFGINAIAGLQYDLTSVPLALAFDFRPGYGCSFVKGTSGHFFDWKLAFAVRYRL